MIVFIGTRSKRTKNGVKPSEDPMSETILKEWIKRLVPKGHPYFVVDQCKISIKDLWDYHLQAYIIVALGVSTAFKLNPVPCIKLPHPSETNPRLDNRLALEFKFQEAEEYIKLGVEKTELLNRIKLITRSKK